MSVCRKLCFLALAALLLSFSPSQAGKPGGGGSEPPTPDWEFRSDLGGWLDGNTGLVWGMNATDFLDAQGNWTYSRDVILPEYRAATGFTDWRMPTQAEVTAAAASDYYGHVLANFDSISVAPEVTWTSEGSGVWRYYGNLETDGLDLVITGDKASNSVQVLFDGVDVLVRGLDGTRINGGAADFVAAAATNTLPGSVGVGLLKGHDLFYMSGGVTVTSNILVEPSPGNDSTVILDATVTEDIIVGIPFTSTNDAGNDRVAISDSTAANIFLSLGAGHDLATFGGAVASENIVALMGTGNDGIFGDLEATENVIVGMGAGNDLMIGDVTAGGIGIDMEAGNDALHLLDVDQNDPTRLAMFNLGTGNDKATIGLGTVTFASELQVTGSTGKDQFFLVPGATLTDGVSIIEVESTAPYLVIADPALNKQFSGTIKRLDDFGLFLTLLPP